MSPFARMFRRIAACGVLFFGLILKPLPVSAGGIDGRFIGRIDGVDTRLVLQSRGKDVTGQYEEGALRLDIVGTFEGKTLSAQVLEPGKQAEIAQIEGTLNGDALDSSVRAMNPATGQTRNASATFRREGSGPSAAAASAANGALDPKLIGTWANENVINSRGSNAASFATTRTLQLSADGRVTQWVQSAGGGGDWSYGGGGRKLEYQGHWFTKDGVMHVQLDGSSGFKPATRYRFSDTFLVTENEAGRLIWQRR